MGFLSLGWILNFLRLHCIHLFLLPRKIQSCQRYFDPVNVLHLKMFTLFLGGFSVRPFVRSIQRQSLSSRSSIASPLAFSDSGIKPSWSLSAKLHMRSNSPSRFSLDSRCSPPLERIGEACDDKVSTSCFGSYSRHERYFGSRSPLSMMESNQSDQDNNKRFLDMMYCRAPTPVEKKSTKNEPTENNNQITAIDQNSLPAQATPSKEQKRKSSIGGFGSKAESTGSTKSSSKGETEKTSKKRLCATYKSSTSESTSSTPVKGKKVSSTKEKSVNAKKSTSTPSGTPSKTKEATHPVETPQHKPCVRSTPQSSASPSPTSKKNSSINEKSSTSSRKKLVERSFSRDSMHLSPVVDSLRGTSVTRSPLSKSGESNRPERRLIRSSSSSSSVTSLRSPSISTRDLQRSSKPEEKGLSFFKSALRQRESRRSADLGKSTLLAKKASERTCKQNGQAKDISGDKGKTGDAVSSQTSTETHGGETKSETKTSSKPPSSLSRTLLNVGKSKSSTSEVSLKSPANGKKPLERMASSRKLSSSMQSPARTTQRPQWYIHSTLNLHNAAIFFVPKFQWAPGVFVKRHVLMLWLSFLHWQHMHMGTLRFKHWQPAQSIFSCSGFKLKKNRTSAAMHHLVFKTVRTVSYTFWALRMGLMQVRKWGVQGDGLTHEMISDIEGTWASLMHSAVEHTLFDCVYWRPIWQLTEFPVGILKSNYPSIRQEPCYIFAVLQSVSLVCLLNSLLEKNLI